jgi:hypothetical protein
VTLLCLVVGIIFGLLVTWVLWPVEFTNADVVDLRQSYKDDYLRMISSAYMADGDLAAARQRLVQLGLANPIQSIGDLIVRDKASLAYAASLDALSNLSRALLTPSATSALSAGQTAVSLTPQAILVIAATPTPSAPAFSLVEHMQLGCQDEPDAAYLVFVVRDVSGAELPNVGIQVRWAGGDDVVYTGLKPERGIGYADYQAAPGTFSATILSARSDQVSDLVIGDPPADCRADRGATPRGWKLVFQQQ